MHKAEEFSKPSEETASAEDRVAESSLFVEQKVFPSTSPLLNAIRELAMDFWCKKLHSKAPYYPPIEEQSLATYCPVLETEDLKDPKPVTLYTQLPIMS